MAFKALLQPGNTPAVSQTIVLGSGQGARISIYSIEDGAALPQAVRFEIEQVDGDFKINRGRLKGFDRTKVIEGPGTFTLSRPAFDGPYFGASFELVSQGGYPSKTLAELAATYLAADHIGQVVMVSDGTESPATYAFSLNGKWLSVYTRAVLTTDPVAHVRGWHIQGLESFGTGKIPGVAGTDYNPPVAADFDYLKLKGGKVARISMLWERAQPKLNGQLDTTYLGYIDACVAMAKARGLKLILDPCHGTAEASGGRYVDGVVYKIGTAQVPIAAWTDYLVKMYLRYGNDPAIYAIDVCNEPINMPVAATPGNYDPSKTELQYLFNPNFAKSTRGWTLGSTFARVADGSGGFCIEQRAAGGYDNFTTANDVSSGIMLPAGKYNLTLEYKAQIDSGNPSVVQINTVNPFGNNGGANLASGTFTAAADYTRLAVAFTVPAGGARTYLRFMDNGGKGLNRYRKINITPGADAVKYISSAFTGLPYATTSLMHRAAVDALRGAGCTYRIWLETEAFAGPHAFVRLYGDSPDVWWNDPLGKTDLSYHYYLDEDHSGQYLTEWTQATRDRQAQDLDPIHAWGKEKGIRIAVGETGVPSDGSASSANYRTDWKSLFQRWDAAGMDVMVFAAGQQFSSITTVQPTGGADLTAMAVMAPHMA